MYYIKHYFKKCINNIIHSVVYLYNWLLIIYNNLGDFMKKKTDLRIIKTHKALYKALIDLLKEMEYEKIKISDLCTKAMVNRSTFYAHFNDKYDLFDSFLKDLKQGLIDELDGSKKIDNVRDYYLELIKVFINHIDINKETYKSIIVNNRNSIILDMLYDTIKMDFKKKNDKFSKTKTDIPEDIMLEFYLGGIINLGIYFINSNKYSKDDIINDLLKLLPKDI